MVQALFLCLLCCLPKTVLSQRRTYVDSLLADIARTKSDTEKVKSLIRLAVAYRPNFVTSEFYYANKALSLSENVDWDTGKMYAEEFLGECYNSVMAYNDAIVHFKRSIALTRALKRTDVEITCLQLLFHSYNKINDMPEALACQKTLLELTERTGDISNESNQMSAYALCFSDMGRYREAIDWLKKDIAIVKSRFAGAQRTNQLANLLNNIANTYIKVGRTDSALYCLRTATALANATKNYFLNAYIASTFCDVYTAAKNDDSALIYGRRTVKMAEVINDINLEQHYCQALSNLYEEQHMPGHALDYYRKSDSLMNIINSTQKTIGQAMEVNKINIEQQTEHGRQEKRAFDIIRRNQRVALIAAVAAIIAFMALTIFIYRNLRQKQNANEVIGLQAESLQKQNEIIDKALKEKEDLLKETHHRVKNNLQLISSLLELQAANIEDEGAKNALHTAQRRVLSIATVHSKLYDNSEQEVIEFSAFANDLYSRLEKAFGSVNKVTMIDNAIPSIFFPLNTVVLLGLILNELITNSFKHACINAEVLKISLHLDLYDGKYTLCYHDNGPGLKENVFNEGSGSLGLYLIKRLSKQLKGTAAYRFEGGSTFNIIFPDAGS